MNGRKLSWLERRDVDVIIRCAQGHGDAVDVEEVNGWSASWRNHIHRLRREMQGRHTVVTATHL